MAEIMCKDLELAYEGNVLIRDLNFSVERGDYLCIVGENGAGKSTLMRTLLRLQAPAGGRVEYGDGLTSREIGYLPQQTAVQKDFPASVREIVLSGCEGQKGLRPFYNKKDRALAADAMEKLGLTELAGRCYRELSGGQQQRVLLARALCAAKRVLFLDEPVSGLDPMVSRDMYRLLSRLNREGMSIVMISHDVEASVRNASHILHLGQQLFFGPVEDFAASAAGQRYLNGEGGLVR